MKNPAPLLALFVVLFLVAGVSFGEAPAATTVLTSAEAQEDFDLMRQALEEAHSGLYRYSTKAEIDRAFDAQRANLAKGISTFRRRICTYPL